MRAFKLFKEEFQRMTYPQKFLWISILGVLVAGAIFCGYMAHTEAAAGETINMSCRGGKCVAQIYATGYPSEVYGTASFTEDGDLAVNYATDESSSYTSLGPYKYAWDPDLSVARPICQATSVEFVEQEPSTGSWHPFGKQISVTNLMPCRGGSF